MEPSLSAHKIFDGSRVSGGCPEGLGGSRGKPSHGVYGFLQERLACISSLRPLVLCEHRPGPCDESPPCPTRAEEPLGKVPGPTDQTDKLAWEVLTALARAVDASSPWTAYHSERVAGLASRIGAVVGFGSKDENMICRAGLLHDIGKIGVAASILDKPGELTHDESRCMEEHPRIGARILEPISTYADIIPMVLQHHERFCGTGYPQGLSGEGICPGARILAVADVYDALAFARPYRAGWGRKRAVEAIKEGAGGRFDKEVVEGFLEVVAQDKQGGIREEPRGMTGITSPSRSFAFSFPSVNFGI